MSSYTPPRVRVPQVEYHLSTVFTSSSTWMSLAYLFISCVHKRCLLCYHVRGVTFLSTLLLFVYRPQCRRQSQWPSGLRRVSAADRVLGLRVRIPPGSWMCVVIVVCCQVEVSATGRFLVQRSPTDCDVSLRYSSSTPAVGVGTRGSTKK